MATFKFFNIGKANEEITRLEAENATLKEDAKNASENAAAIATNAEGVTAELTQLKADHATAKASISSLTARAEKAETELKAANEKLANPSAQIKEAGSREALKITQALGVPPVTASSSAPAQTGDPLATFNAIKDPVARTEWYRKNKAAYDAAWRAQHPAKPETTI